MKSESSISDGVFRTVSHVAHVFKRNETHRSTSGSTNVLTSALEAWARKPPQEDLNLFRSMGVLPNTYDSLTRTKLIQIMAVLNRVFAQVGDKSWGLISSPSPTLPEEVDAGIVAKYANEGLKVAEGIGASTVEEIVAVVADTLKMNEDQIESDRQKFASDRAQRMEKVVDDILFEAGFTINIMRQFIENLTKFGTAVIIGPYEVSTLVSKLRGSGDSVKYRPEIEKQLRFFVPSTLDVYPSPGTINVDDGDLCVVVRYSRQELTRAAKTASKNNKGGWRRDAINTLLEDKPAGCTLETLDIADPVIRAATLGEVVGTTVRYEGVRWFGMMKGSDLRSVGVSTDGIAEIIGDNYYDAEMIVVAGQLVYANVADPAIGRPLVKTTFYCDSLQFFGWPVATQIDNCQKLMNLVMASLKKQLQLSGLVPLMVNDYSSFADADKPGAFALTPGKVFLRNNNSFSQPGGQRPPVEPLVLPTIIRECITLFESIGKLADDASGFNRNMLGSGNFAGAARALADYEKVLIPAGEVEISKLKVGDSVMNTYSGVSKVTGVYPQGERDILRIFFSNGEHVDCDPEHRWTISDHPDRPTSWKTRTTQEIIEAGLFRKTIVSKKNPKGYRPKWALPYVECLGYEHKDVPIDPYTLGALIGNGDKRCRLCVLDNEVFERVPYELGVPDTTNCGKATTRTVLGVKEAYHALGLGVHGLDKFIPDEYLRNSKDVRFELLRGLMDTDGCASENGDHVFYSTSSWRLAKDFVTLVKSLGATSVSLRSEAGSDDTIKGRKITRARNYRICFNLDQERVFWLDRKQRRVHKRPRVRVYITGIDLIGRNSATCITVDSKDSLFLCANYIPTHNTATGLMQIQEAASIIASYVIGNIDAMAVVPILNKVVSWINYHHPDQSVKGDPQIIARGQLSKVMKSAESQVVAAGFNATQTGVMPQLLGPEKMLIALREYLKSIDFPNVDQIIPDEKRIQFLAQMEDVERSLGMLDKASAQQDPGQGGAPPQGGAVSGAAMGQEQPKRPYTRSVETDAGLKPQGNVEARRGVA